MTTMFVKPAEGGRIRIPERKMAIMKPEGDFVVPNSYWNALLASRDVVEAEPPEQVNVPDPEPPAATDEGPQAPAEALPPVPAEELLPDPTAVRKGRGTATES